MPEKKIVPGKPLPEEPSYVACSICLTEIPESVAVSSEADEYAQHFCGITCYTQWRDESDNSNETKTLTENVDP